MAVSAGLAVFGAGVAWGMVDGKGRREGGFELTVR